ncbi:hypothetical protein J4H86_08310 [Spiractinospora alimapuensis]|uniref:hypothetical protein n=1 Tax=Spiractinospora alimapuensis TaxID=2820884 RepID=UPI001F2066AA|nr:hypothetical protein [Spiractinospora alimapuensis]QVQ53708.1 hypothetical protein J4H86_08310 [Spiractinospora alimapuensis]
MPPPPPGNHRQPPQPRPDAHGAAFTPQGPPPGGATPAGPARENGPSGADTPTDDLTERRTVQGLVITAMVLVLLALIAGNVVMVRPGAGDADAREAPAPVEQGDDEEAAAESEPVVLEGTGDAEESFEPFIDIGYLAVEHTGETILVSFDTGNGTEDSEIDTFHQWLPYSGATVINEDEAAIQGLSVQADGDWSVELHPLTNAPEWDGSPIDGEFDAVYQYTGPEAPVDVRVAADYVGPIYVEAYPYENPLFDVTNESPLDETFTFESTPSVIEVNAAISSDAREDDLDLTPEWTLEVL